MVAIIDDSFKKPGAIPFKWEIRPGVPKITQPESPRPQQPLSPPALPSPSTPFYPQTTARPLSRSPSPNKHALKPPPLLAPTTASSSPRARSQRWRFDDDHHHRHDQQRPPRRRREAPCVSSPGCFPSSPMLLRRKDSSRRKGAEDWSPDIGVLSARWSVSSRRSSGLSPRAFSESPLSSASFSSYQSSPRFFRPAVVSEDPEWAGFGLF